MNERTRTTTTVQPTEAPATGPVAAAPVPGPSILIVIARLVYWVLGFVEVALLFRVFFALLGANPTNAVAHFVYNVSEPLARPFFTLFSYQPTQGISRLEIGTIAAMVVYAVVAWGIVMLLTMARPAEKI